MKTKNRTQWRSMNALLATSEERQATQQEFPEGASELPLTDVNRRQFLGLLGASAALAGVGLQGCMRKRVEHIVPFTSRPEDYLPGEARYYASNLLIGAEVVPVLVRSSDGRPSKIDGNPRSTETLGRSTAFAQAEILKLYDTDRARNATRGDEELSWAQAEDELSKLRQALAANSGEGVALVLAPSPSLTLRAQLDAFQSAYPQATTFVVDEAVAGHQAAALAASGAEGGQITYDLAEAKVLVSLDADILHSESDALRNTVAFSTKRTISTPQSELNRLYSVEPTYSVTGSNADHHLRVPASQIGEIAKAIAAGVGVAGVTAGNLSEDEAKLVAALVSDLQANRGTSAVAVGERQPAWVHQLGLAINEAVGNIGATVSVVQNPALPTGGDLVALNDALASGSITTVITLEVNPVYAAPASLGFAENYAKAETRVALAFHNDETASQATLHIPAAHALETWGDFLSNTGQKGIQQPLIEPLFDSISPIEFLEALTNETVRDSYDIVVAVWRDRVGGIGFQDSWNRWLHDGIGPSETLAQLALSTAGAGAAATAATIPAAPSASSIELIFQNSPTILDGRYANTSWMQEYPHPISKLTWDNAALMSPETAANLDIKWGSGQRLGAEEAQILEISAGGRSIKLAAFIIPGIAPNTIVTEFGYGREIGYIAKGAGVNVRPLLAAEDGWIISNVSVSVTRDTYMLATTQDHWSLVPMDNPSYARPLVLETDIGTYRQRPNFILDDELMRPSQLHSLWTEPNPRTGQQWGLSIDLTSCTGCGACTIACQAENNIAIVGKEEVLNGRELHWIRIDRYFTGDEANPGIVQQPVGCMHCETAPCEQVCPVAATIHSPDGLNDMVYNRCIGTRYCANNCPYKVRRFNFFAYNKYETQSNELLELQRNPRVTIRHRGVMEKCTYCVQRISEARVEAKRDSDGIIADGAVQTACQQACPAGSIVFGDINDPTSAVSVAKRQDRNYVLLSWLNVKPRTSYLAKVRNPNPDLA